MSHVASPLPAAVERFNEIPFADRVRLAGPAARVAILRAFADPGRRAADDGVDAWVQQAFGIEVPQAVFANLGEDTEADARLLSEWNTFVDAVFALGVAAGLNVRPELFER